MATANHHTGHSSSYSVSMRIPVYSSPPLLVPPTHSRRHLPHQHPTSGTTELSSSCTFSTASSPFSALSHPSLVSPVPLSNPATPILNLLTWYPVSPRSPEPPTILQQVQCFFDERLETGAAATSAIFITATRKFHDVSDAMYRAILRKFFAGDARPHGARIDYYGDRRLVIITFPGLPHELMARFDSAMQQSLVGQGFLWPGWGSEWLGSSGAARINLTHGRRNRVMEPDGGLQVLCQELPFLIVEVANSQDYEDVLEKASWALKYSKGRIRYAILIKLINKTAKERREDEAQAEAEAHERISGKRSLSDLDSSPPRAFLKRVRTDESSVSASSESGESFVDSVRKTTTPPPPSPTNDHSDSSSELSSVSSGKSLPSGNGVVERVTPLVEATAKHVPVVHNHPTDSSPPSIDSPFAATSSISEPPSSPNHPPPPSRYNPRAAFSRAHLTILGTTLTATRRVVTTILDCIELWPTPPGPHDVFSFSWDDMPTPSYPTVLRDKQYTLEFMSLHRTLDLFVKTGDPNWVESHRDLVMKEWKEEVTSGSSGSGEEEEEEEDESGDARDMDSDVDYQE